MSWNYRVIKHILGDEAQFGFHEVYYDQHGNLSGYCQAWIVGDSLEQLEWALDKLQKALREPVLNEDDFDGKPVLDLSDRNSRHSHSNPD